MTGASAAIYGCSGLGLTEDERAFYREAQPWGFILFKRNVSDPAQLSALTNDLRDAVGREAPILIDQEGGRVQRMGPPHWPKYPPGAAYLKATNDPLAARELARLAGRLLAADLKAVGIDVDCAPVLDTPVAGAHDIIGDRAYAQDPATVAQLGRAKAEGLLAGGVLPVIKHIPGHGRAFADSHHELPVVETPLDDLRVWDFAPFRSLSDMPMAMTAHVVYAAIDRRNPATTSKAALKMVRDDLCFDGLIMTDDLSMKALSGSFTERAERSLKAGCDVVLHCNGDIAEMQAVAEGAGSLKGRARARADAALKRIVHTPEPLDEAEARERFALLLVGKLDAARGPDVGEAQ